MLAKLTLLLLLFVSYANADITVVYPRATANYDARMQYPLQLLQLGFQKARVVVRLQASDDVMSQNRALKLLAEKREVNIVWTMTSKEREAVLLPVRIPIYKGLIGWRIALLSSNRAQLLKDIDSIAELTPLIAGQGHDWPDTAILKSNQLSVTGVSNYESLFRLLNKQRIDYFPRAIVEIQQELTQHAGQNLSIDPYLLLHYPTASYFFFNARDKAIADQLETGLNLAIKDGSFDRLFWQFHRDYIAPLNLQGRRIIELHNPYLPEKTPLARRELWFDPLQAKRAD